METIDTEKSLGDSTRADFSEGQLSSQSFSDYTFDCEDNSDTSFGDLVIDGETRVNSSVESLGSQHSIKPIVPINYEMALENERQKAVPDSFTNDTSSHSNMITREVQFPLSKINQLLGPQGNAAVREIYRRTRCMLYINPDVNSGSMEQTIEFSGSSEEVERAVFLVKSVISDGLSALFNNKPPSPPASSASTYQGNSGTLKSNITPLTIEDKSDSSSASNQLPSTFFNESSPTTTSESNGTTSDESSMENTQTTSGQKEHSNANSNASSIASTSSLTLPTSVTAPSVSSSNITSWAQYLDALASVNKSSATNTTQKSVVGNNPNPYDVDTKTPPPPGVGGPSGSGSGTTGGYNNNVQNGSFNNAQGSFTQNTSQNFNTFNYSGNNMNQGLQNSRLSPSISSMSSSGQPSGQTGLASPPSMSNTSGGGNFMSNPTGGAASQPLDRPNLIIKCPPEALNILLGTRGLNLKEIAQRTGANLRVGDRPMPNGFRAIEVRGSTVEAEAARVLVDLVIERGPSMVQPALAVPSAAGATGGAAGSSQYSALNPHHPSAPVFTDFMVCPVEKVGSIIGSQGSVIKEIMRLSGAHVIVCDDIYDDMSPNNRRVRIRGTEAAILHARELIALVVENGPLILSEIQSTGYSQPSRHFPPLPKTSLIGAANINYNIGSNASPGPGLGSMSGAMGPMGGGLGSMSGSYGQGLSQNSNFGSNPGLTQGMSYNMSTSMSPLPGQYSVSQANQMAPPLSSLPPSGSLPQGMKRIEFEVAQDKIGVLIGSNGATIKEIMKRSGARIMINEQFPEGAPRLVECVGSSTEVAIAKDLILDIINKVNGQRKQRPLMMKGMNPMSELGQSQGQDPYGLDSFSSYSSTGGGLSGSQLSSLDSMGGGAGGGGSGSVGGLYDVAQPVMPRGMVPPRPQFNPRGQGVPSLNPAKRVPSQLPQLGLGVNGPIVEVVVDCPVERLPLLLGFKGAIVKEICRRSNAYISIEDPDGMPTRRIRIRGTRDESRMAEEMLWAAIHEGPGFLGFSKEALSRLAQLDSPISIASSTGAPGFFTETSPVGSSGVPSLGSSGRTGNWSVSGVIPTGAAAAAQAQAMAAAQAASRSQRPNISTSSSLSDIPPSPSGGSPVNGPRQVSDYVSCPTERVGLLIGAKGGTIKLIQQLSGATVTILLHDRDENSPFRRVMCRGDMQAVQSAKAIIQNVLNHGADYLDELAESADITLDSSSGGEVVDMVECPIDKLPVVMGMGGSNIKEIMRRTSTSIMIDDVNQGSFGLSSPNNRRLLIRGAIEDIEAAKIMIQTVIERGSGFLESSAGMGASSSGPPTLNGMNSVNYSNALLANSSNLFESLTGRQLDSLESKQQQQYQHQQMNLMIDMNALNSRSQHQSTTSSLTNSPYGLSPQSSPIASLLGSGGAFMGNKGLASSADNLPPSGNLPHTFSSSSLLQNQINASFHAQGLRGERDGSGGGGIREENDQLRGLYDGVGVGYESGKRPVDDDEDFASALRDYITFGSTTMNDLDDPLAAGAGLNSSSSPNGSLRSGDLSSVDMASFNINMEPAPGTFFSSL